MADKKWSEVEQISQVSNCARLPILDTKCCDPESEDNVLTNYTIAVQDFLYGINQNLSSLNTDCTEIQNQIETINQNITDITSQDFDQRIQELNDAIDAADTKLQEIETALQDNDFIHYSDIKTTTEGTLDCEKQVPSICLVKTIENKVNVNAQDCENLYEDYLSLNNQVNELRQRIGGMSITLGFVTNWVIRAQGVTSNFWNKSVIFSTFAELEEMLQNQDFVDSLRSGDTFYITEANSQDYYWDGEQIQPIEVDLSNYDTKDEVDAKIAALGESSHWGRFTGYTSATEIDGYSIANGNSEVFNDYPVYFDEQDREIKENLSYGGQEITDNYSAAHGKGNIVGSKTYDRVTSGGHPTDNTITWYADSGYLDKEGYYVYLQASAIPSGDINSVDITGYYKLEADIPNNRYTIYLSSNYSSVTFYSTVSYIYLFSQVYNSSGYNHISGYRNQVEGNSNQVSGKFNKVSSYNSVVSGENNKVFNSENTTVVGNENTIYYPNIVYKDAINAQRCKNNLICGNNNEIKTGDSFQTANIHEVQIFGNDNTVEDAQRCLVGGEYNKVYGNYVYTTDAIVYGYRNYCSGLYASILGRANKVPNTNCSDGFIVGVRNIIYNPAEVAVGRNNASFNPTNATQYSNSFVIDDPNNEETIFTIGNGSSVDPTSSPNTRDSESGSNAFAVTRYRDYTDPDHPAEMVEKAKVYIWHNGQFVSLQSILTKLETKIPDCPTTTDGTFTLTCTVTGGVPTYSWV